MSEVMWSVVMWSELTWFMWSDFVLKWREVSYGEVPGDESTMYIRVTLYWGYLIVLWLFHLVCILYCGCFNWFCDVWVSVYGGVLVIWVLVFTVFCIVCIAFLYCFFYVNLFSFVLSVLVEELLPPSENWIAVSNNNNNNNNNNNIYWLSHISYTTYPGL